MVELPYETQVEQNRAAVRESLRQLDEEYRNTCSLNGDAATSSQGMAMESPSQGMMEDSLSQGVIEDCLSQGMMRESLSQGMMKDPLSQGMISNSLALEVSFSGHDQ